MRPFEWGLDWVPVNGHRGDAAAIDAAQAIGDWVSHVMADTDAFFTPPPTGDYTLQRSADGDVLTFPSALETRHETNNTVYCRYFPARLKERATKSPAPLKGRPTTEAGGPADLGRRFSGADPSGVGHRFSGALAT